jgi:hypothetical protein
MKLDSEVCNVSDLTRGDREAMYLLMAQCYGNVHRNQFDSDLDAKRWAIVLRRCNDNRLVGFSTQVVLEARVADVNVRALYSGDTVVDRDHWGDPALAHAWGRFALDLIDCVSTTPLYWFLTSKGFRTYHYLPLFFRTYFPCPAIKTPAWEQSVIEALGTMIGGCRFESGSGIIRVAASGEFVRPEFDVSGTRCKTDDRARFFADCNPGFSHGDELCCLAPLSRGNFTAVAHRVIGRQPRNEGALTR